LLVEEEVDQIERVVVVQEDLEKDILLVLILLHL
jgi:hypothetical protein